MRFLDQPTSLPLTEGPLLKIVLLALAAFTVIVFIVVRRRVNPPSIGSIRKVMVIAVLPIVGSLILVMREVEGGIGEWIFGLIFLFLYFSLPLAAFYFCCTARIGIVRVLIGLLILAFITLAALYSTIFLSLDGDFTNADLLGYVGRLWLLTGLYTTAMVSWLPIRER